MVELKKKIKSTLIMAHDVFISYSSDDAKLARRISNVLTKMGISVYLDQKKINWGDNIAEEVMGGLAESIAVIVILSPGSHKSEWVPFEVGHAMAIRKRILPYLSHRSQEVPLYLRGLHYATSVTEVKKYFSSIRGSQTGNENKERDKFLEDLKSEQISLSPSVRLHEILKEYPNGYFQGQIAIDGVVELMSFPTDTNRYGGITHDQTTTNVTSTEWSSVAKSGAMSKEQLVKLSEGLIRWMPPRRAKPNRIRYLVTPPVQPVLDHKELVLNIGNSDYFTMRAVAEISRNENRDKSAIKLNDIFNSRWGEAGKNFPSDCIPYHISAQGIIFITDPETEIKYLVLTMPSGQRSPLVRGWNATFAEQMWAPSPSTPIRAWWEDYTEGFEIESPKDRFGDEDVEATLMRGLMEELGINKDDLNTPPKLISACIEEDLYFVTFIFVLELRMSLKELYIRKESAADREIGNIAAYPIEGVKDGIEIDSCKRFVKLLKEDSFDGSPYILPLPTEEMKGQWHLSSRMRIYAAARHLLGNEILQYVHVVNEPMNNMNN